MSKKPQTEDLSMTEYTPQFSLLFEDESEQAQKVMRHKAWLHSIRHERPNTEHHYKVGVYIRYFNQTKYQDYLSFHKKQLADSIALCPNWELVGFYIDEGQSAPNMETASEWSRLITDCYEGKVDLIITQKISNVTHDISEVTFCCRLLAAHDPPIGVYFISEDIFTLASYYRNDLYDPELFPSDNWEVLPDPDAKEYDDYD